MSHSITEMREREPMWVYEKNYTFLVKLFPFLLDDSEMEQVLGHQNDALHLKVVERCPYTQTLDLKQSMANETAYIDELRMKIRVYHDARLVEVVNYQGISRMQPNFEYSNSNVLSRDDKRQANVLLHDWLSTYIAAGHARSEEAVCS